MRRKYAKRLRRKVMRLGATIIREGTVIKTGERKRLGIPKKEQGYTVVARFNNSEWHICVGYDALDAYRTFIEAMEYELREADHGA